MQAPFAWRKIIALRAIVVIRLERLAFSPQSGWLSRPDSLARRVLGSVLFMKPGLCALLPATVTQSRSKDSLVETGVLYKALFAEVTRSLWALV